MDKNVYKLSYIESIEEIDTVQKIASQWPDELSFIKKQQLADAAKKHELLVARLISDNSIVAFMLYHIRQDKTITIYDIAVDKNHLKQGIAKEMIESLHGKIRLKCVKGNAANDFRRSLVYNL